MFGYYLGTFWIVMGAYFLWRPAALVKRIKKKGMKLVRRYLIAACIFGTGTIFGLAFDIAGVWPKGVAVALTVALWIAAFRWFRKTKERFGDLIDMEMDEAILTRVAWVHVVVGMIVLAITIAKSRG